MTVLRTLAIAGLTLAASVPAHATDYLSHRIPASGCTPASEADFAKLHLVEGSWEYISSASGTASLVCPVRYVHYLNDPLIPEKIGAMRVWYRDPSGTGAWNDVTVQLASRGWTGPPSNIGLSWSSSTHAVTTDIAYELLYNVDFEPGITHYVEVELYRGSVWFAGPRLTGIDFRHIPPAP